MSKAFQTALEPHEFELRILDRHELEVTHYWPCCCRSSCAFWTAKSSAGGATTQTFAERFLKTR